MIPKQPRFVSKKHLQFVASHKCCLAFNLYCGGGVQAHHLLKPWNGIRGMGIKANDKNVIPLCYHHHAELHDKVGDEEKFFTNYKLPKEFGKMVAVYLWTISPENEGNNE